MTDRNYCAWTFTTLCFNDPYVCPLSRTNRKYIRKRKLPNVNVSICKLIACTSKDPCFMIHCLKFSRTLLYRL